MIPVNNSSKQTSWMMAMFQDFAARSFEIKGEFYDARRDDINSIIKKTPYMFVDIGDQTLIQDGNGRFASMELTFTVYVADKQLVSEENQTTAATTTRRILTDMVAELSQHPYYVQNKVKLVNDVSISTTFTTDDDVVVRSFCDITLRVPFDAKYCATPIGPIPLYTSTTIDTFQSATQSICDIVKTCGTMGPTGAQGPIGPTGVQGVAGSGGTGSSGATGGVGGFTIIYDNSLNASGFITGELAFTGPDYQQDFSLYVSNVDKFGQTFSSLYSALYTAINESSPSQTQSIFIKVFSTNSPTDQVAIYEIPIDSILVQTDGWILRTLLYLGGHLDVTQDGQELGLSFLLNAGDAGSTGPAGPQGTSNTSNIGSGTVSYYTRIKTVGATGSILELEDSNMSEFGSSTFLTNNGSGGGQIQLAVTDTDNADSGSLGINHAGVSLSLVSANSGNNEYIRASNGQIDTTIYDNINLVNLTQIAQDILDIKLFSSKIPAFTPGLIAIDAANALYTTSFSSGPQGDQGPQGPAGGDGVTGAQGPAGTGGLTFSGTNTQLAYFNSTTGLTSSNRLIFDGTNLIIGTGTAIIGGTATGSILTLQATSAASSTAPTNAFMFKYSPTLEAMRFGGNNSGTETYLYFNGNSSSTNYFIRTGTNASGFAYINALADLRLSVGGANYINMLSAQATIAMQRPTVLVAGTTTLQPLRFQSGTNLTTAVNGSMEYNGTNLFFTRTAATREAVLIGNTASAPSTSVGVGIVNYFGSSATNFLGQPVGWISVTDNAGVARKIPFY